MKLEDALKVEVDLIVKKQTVRKVLESCTTDDDVRMIFSQAMFAAQVQGAMMFAHDPGRAGEAGTFVPPSKRTEKMEDALIQIKSLEEGIPHSCWAITQEKLFEATKLASEALGTTNEEED